ncbi:MAG: cell wall-binding repeat-containing protein [Coriobacteriales bacterium]|nr:cell wall-binding repeat-containing protein [Coriobacteriales bacterium]
MRLRFNHSHNRNCRRAGTCSVLHKSCAAACTFVIIASLVLSPVAQAQETVGPPAPTASTSLPALSYEAQPEETKAQQGTLESAGLEGNLGDVEILPDGATTDPSLVPGLIPSDPFADLDGLGLLTDDASGVYDTLDVGTLAVGVMVFRSSDPAQGTVVVQGGSSVANGDQMVAGEEGAAPVTWPTVSPAAGYRLNCWYRDAATPLSAAEFAQERFAAGATHYYVAHFVKSRALRELGGATRYDSMANIAQSGAFATGGTVVVTSGEKDGDISAAISLAGLEGAPTVLTTAGSLPAQAQATLRALNPSKIYLVGGTATLSVLVQRQIEAVAPQASIERFDGIDRLATSSLVYAKGRGQWSNTAIIANGYSFPDILSIAPYSYAMNVPVLLTRADGTLSDAIYHDLRNGGFTEVVIVGSTASVAQGTENLVRTTVTSQVTRLGGADRYATSLIIADWLTGRGLGYDYLGVTTGKNFPDALTGAALQGIRHAILLLLPDDTYSSAIQRINQRTDIIEVSVFGATSTVSQGNRDQICYGMLPQPANQYSENWANALVAVEVHSHPSASSPIVGSLAAGQSFLYYPYDTSSSWYAVLSNSGTQYVRNTTGNFSPRSDYSAYTAMQLRVRFDTDKVLYARPIGSASQVATLPAGSVLVSRVYNVGAGWYFSLYGGRVVFFTAAGISSTYYVTLTGDANLDAALGRAFDASINEGMSASDRLWQSYRYVVDSYRYRTKSVNLGPNWINEYGYDMLATGSGNCFSFAALFGLMARAIGYDAHSVAGAVGARGGGTTPHGWVEVWQGGQRYICDPEGEYELKINLYWQTSPRLSYVW